MTQKIFLLIFVILYGGGFMIEENSSVQSKSGSGIRFLPKLAPKGGMSLLETLWQRRSVRSFSSKTLSDNEISQLLFAAQGISDTQRSLRTAPSAGATYPLETYLVTADGLYHYLPDKHALRMLKSGDIRSELSAAALGQNAIREAPAIIIFSAIFERTTGRYRDRGVRYVYIEVGHAAQNVHLMAVALGLASVPIGAFDDAKVARIIGVSQSEKVLYLIPVGKAR